MPVEETIAALVARNERAIIAAPRPVVLPDVDDEPQDEKADRSVGEADGQSFMIEYVNGRGEQSCRRITVYSIEVSVTGKVSLFALCHERHAPRRFRVDRVSACIDYDGQVHEDVAGFLALTFGMDVQTAGGEPMPVSEDMGAWGSLRHLVRPDAVILMALSQCDGRMRGAEVQIATDHCARFAERQGIFVTEPLCAMLVSFLERQRPSASMLVRACDAVRLRPERDIRALLAAAVDLMDVDGVRDPREVDLINDLSTEIVGIPII